MTFLKRAPDTIERIALSDLTPFGRNARKHSARQVQQIVKSIRQFGFTNAILIDDRNRILAGEGRYLAAKDLGLAWVPCVRLSGLSEQEQRAYVLTDNKLSLNSSWDTGLLAIELKDLLSSDIQIDVTGFDTPEIDLVISGADKTDPTSTLDDENEVPAPSLGAVTRQGDVWVLGRHRLICGDARDKTALANLLNGEIAAMIFTDPPYNIPIAGFVSGKGRTRHREFIHGAGELSSEQFISFLTESFGVANAHLADGAIAFACIDWRHLQEMLSAGHAIFTELKQLCVWEKQTAGMGTFYRSQHEMVLVWKKGVAPHQNNFGLGDKGRRRTNVWSYPGLNGFTADRQEQLELHCTVKPVAMVADAILDVSRRGEIVLDPFAGSGTTVIAAERTGRSARVVELDPLYCDVIVRRWEKQTGRSAHLASSELSFEQAERSRSGWGVSARELSDA